MAGSNGIGVTTAEQSVIVVPCFNEAKRLNHGQVAVLLDDRRTFIVFVDDGSTDRTAAVLEEITRKYPDRVLVERLVTNRGKAEAVRSGFQRAIEMGPVCIGYLDADFATPAAEYLRLVDRLLGSPDVKAVLGARVALLGRCIERNQVRHYLGRIFGTFASFVLGLRVYDTQCGAKVFRAEGRLFESMSEPFVSRWVFDVEILSRLTQPGGSTTPLVASQFAEIPLREWHDVAGSKLRPTDMFRSLGDLIAIWRQRRE